MRRAVATLTLALALSACGAGKVDEAKGDTDAPTSSTTVTDDDVKTYFEAMASNDVSELKEVVDLTKPGSLAAAYTNYMIQNATATVAAGQPDEEPDRLTQTKDGWKMCQDDGKKEFCTVYTKIEADHGKLATFDVSGIPLAKRITVGPGKPVAFGKLGTVELLTSYKTASNDLYVTFRVRNTSDGSWSFSDQSAYVDPSGAQTGIAGISGPSSILAGATTIVAAYIKAGEPGGSVHLDAFSNDGGLSAKVTIKTR